MSSSTRSRRPTPAHSLLAAFAAFAVLAATVGPHAARAGVVEGRVFEDWDGDGRHDPEEPALADVDVSLRSAGWIDSGRTAMDGTFGIPTSGGCRALEVLVPRELDPSEPSDSEASPRWRASLADWRTCPPPDSEPVGRLRLGSPLGLVDRLETGALYLSLGDSIAAGQSFCLFDLGRYVPDVAERLECLGGTPLAWDNLAISGSHAEDLLTPTISGLANRQYLPSVIDRAPDVVTISIGGNDFLSTEPNEDEQSLPFAPGALESSLRALVETRATVQEVLSSLTSELPGATISVNSVYDNLAAACSTTDFHALVTPFWNQALRDAAWGQRRPAVVAEVAPELAHQDSTRASCCGAQDRICSLDDTHPTEEGARSIEHAVTEGFGAVEAPTDASVLSRLDVGWQRLVATLEPARTDVLGGVVDAEGEALAIDGVGALVSMSDGWMEVGGFELPAGVVPSAVVVGIRYRTVGASDSDVHRFDASFVGFAPPEWTLTGWNTVTPLVGGSSLPGSTDEPPRVNAVPVVPDWREVTALVTLDAVDDGAVDGEPDWPSPDEDDVARLALRLRTSGDASAAVEWDGAWAWIFGRRAEGSIPGEVSPPGSATPLRVGREDPTTLRLEWAREASSETYRVHEGRLGDWAGASADPASSRGGCTSALEIALPSAPGDRYYLVSGVSVEGFEGPLGSRSDGAPRDAGTPTCP